MVVLLLYRPLIALCFKGGEVVSSVRCLKLFRTPGITHAYDIL